MCIFGFSFILMDFPTKRPGSSENGRHRTEPSKAVTPEPKSQCPSKLHNDQARILKMLIILKIHIILFRLLDDVLHSFVRLSIRSIIELFNFIKLSILN